MGMMKRLLEQMAEAHQQGESEEAIAKRFNYPVEEVRKHLRWWGKNIGFVSTCGNKAPAFKG